MPCASFVDHALSSRSGLVAAGLQEASLQRVDAAEITADLIDEVLLVGIERDALFAGGRHRRQRKAHAGRHNREDPLHLCPLLCAYRPRWAQSDGNKLAR